MQIGGAAGEVAGEAASHEVALLASTLGAEHLGGVLVPGGCPFLPVADLGAAVVGLTFIDHHRLVREQRDDGVDVAKIVSLSSAVVRQTVGMVLRALMP